MSSPPQSRAVPVSAVVMTRDEELNLEACLWSLAGWVDDLVIVDSFSSDRTMEIAARYTARIFQHEYHGPPQQWAWALAHVGLRHDWLLTMDADFRVTPELRSSIEQAVGRGGGPHAFMVRRLQVFRGRPLRHGGLYPRREIRLVRHAVCKVNAEDAVDQLFWVPGGIGELRGDLIEENLKEDDISFWIDKHNRFSSLQALQECTRRRDPRPPLYVPRLFGSAAERRLWLKERWYDLPLFFRPVLYFLFRYFVLLGFLDGKQGFIYHLLQGYWYRLVVDIKLEMLLKRPPGEGVSRGGG